MPHFKEVKEEGEGSGEEDVEQCQKKCEPRSYSRISSSNRESPFRVNIVRSCFRTRHHCIKVQSPFQL